MLFLSTLKRRFYRVLICLKRSLPKALAVHSVIMLIYTVFIFIYFGGSIYISELLEYMLLFLAVSLIIFFVSEINHYGLNLFHRYDDDVIGNAFADLSRKSAIFEQALECFHSGDLHTALSLFTELDDEKYHKTQEEQGVLSFYRGHTYFLLGVYPNAVIHYQKSADKGFDTPPMKLFMARAHARNGETLEAMMIYEKLIDSDYEYTDHIRTDIGHMYLELNDGENAVKWFLEAVNKRENYPTALGGAAISLALLGKYEQSRRFYNSAILNNIPNIEDFKSYYKQVREAADTTSVSKN